MFEGKMKAVTFSYDDGVTQDGALIDIFNRYGLKATFNLNSGFQGKDGSLLRNGKTIAHCKFKDWEVPGIYKGHEIAVHTLTHPNLTECNDEEVIRQVEKDRLNLSSFIGSEVIGMAYPGGGVNYDSRVSSLVKNNTGVKYARTTVCNDSFDLQDNLYEFKPTVYHLNWGKMFSLAEEFINLKPDSPKIFYIWGHAYEFDYEYSWQRFEEFCKMIAYKDDIYYGTNSSVLLAKH